MPNLVDPSNLQPLLFLAALTLMILILLRRSHRKLGRRPRDEEPMVRIPRPRREPSQHATLDAPPDVLRWEVQMHETARDLSAQLDSKMSALQALIADADRAATRLEAALGQSPVAQTPGPPPANDKPPTQAHALESSEASSRREEIYTLADEGLNPVDIAIRTGLPIGEVELTLSLRDRP